MGRQEVKELVTKQNWDELLASDQLRCEHGAGNTFTGFTEGPITFPPTYKYRVNVNVNAAGDIKTSRHFGVINDIKYGCERMLFMKKMHFDQISLLLLSN